jgi:hypothetical protein
MMKLTERLKWVAGCLYLVAICTVLWPIELIWYRWKFGPRRS